MSTLAGGENATSVSTRSSLERLLSPQSAAVIGASESPGSIGSWILRNMQRAFEGPLYAVNRKGKPIHGAETVSDIPELPGNIDMAIAVVPADQVVGSIRKCADNGVGGVVVLTSGFSEAGDEGKRMQDEIARISAETGTRIIGPNCIGYMNVTGGVMANFALFPEQPMPTAGSVALVSQSGGFGSYIATKSLLAGLRLGWFVSTGNEVDVNVAQVVANLVERDDVGVILTCVESLRDPEVFIRAAKRADELDKPVLMLKMGRSEQAAQAALSHTASLVGSAEVLDAVCRQYGVIIVESMEELLDLGMIFQNGRRARGNRIGIMTSSGGAGVLMTDCANKEGLTVPPLPRDDAEKIEARMPKPFHGSVANPVDTTAQITAFPDLFQPVLHDVLESDAVDVFTTVTWAIPGAMNDAIIEEYLQSNKPFALLSTDWMEQFQVAGLPTYTDPGRAIHALGVLAAYSNREPLEATESPESGAESRSALSENMPALKQAVMLESQAKELLSAYDIPVTPEEMVSSRAEAVRVASDMGEPVALKVMSYQLLHKSDVGGVRLGVTDVAGEYDSMLADVSQREPDARIEGVLVQEMVPGRLELSCGMYRDPVFGPIVTVGIGGSLIEIIAATELIRAPFGRHTATRAIRNVADGRLLSGRRGLNDVELEAVAQVMVGVGNMAVDHPNISEVDINPLSVFDNRVTAADALILLGGTD